MKIAAVQMVSSTSVASNLHQAQILIQQAVDAGAEMVALPEYFCALGKQDRDKLAYAEAWQEGPIQEAMAAWAQRWNIWLLGGTIPLRSEDGEHVFNSSLLFNPQGSCTARYDKVHLFRFDNGVERYDESNMVQAGQLPVWSTVTDRAGEEWRVGLSVCYDLRFPELYRHYASNAVDLVVIPSAFTHTTGLAHWEVLLRARAIENLCYVLAPAQGGVHENGRRTWGHSMLIDPWGQVVSEQVNEGAGVVMGVLQRTSIAKVRQQLPALEHRVL